MSYLQNFKYDLYGPEEGPKLVFLHGVMGSGANWRKITPAFQDTYRILTYDQRGHGWSFKPKAGYSPEDYSLDLKLILDELGWQKVSLLGHSMGGRNALHFAQKYPQRVESLIIEDIGPQGNPTAMQATINMIELVPTPFLGGKTEAKKYFEGEFQEKLAKNPHRVVLGQYLYTNIESRDDGSADWRFSKDAILSTLEAGHFQPRWDAVRDLQVPTLFIRGEHSRDFPQDEFDKVLQISPMVQGVEIAGAGHWVHFDQSQRFIEVLQNFLMQNQIF